MKEIDTSKPVLVTGGSGYIASWIVKLLLEDGRYVKATVRDKSNSEKIGHLLKMAEEYPEKLELFEADLLNIESFSEPMKDCELVVHCASPYKVWKIKDPQNELIRPALEGTRSVLHTANQTSSVKRIVLTSSVAAIIGDAIDVKNTKNGIFTEDDWNTTSTPQHNPYSYSKTIAEKEAWKIAKEQNQWDLVTINPGVVLGPSLTDRTDSTSIGLMLQLLSGKMKSGVPDWDIYVVDVRDVARAHVIAGDKPSVNGRHILVSENIPFIEISNIMRKKYSQYPLPKGKAPNFIMYIFGPLMGFSWKFLKRNLGIRNQLDNTYSKKDLGIEYRPLEQTLNDHVDQIIESGLLNK